MCGKTEDLVVHHRDGIHFRDEESNRCILCRGCHARLHLKDRKPTNRVELGKFDYEELIKESEDYFEKLEDEVIGHKVDHWAIGTRDKAIFYLYAEKCIKASSLAKEMGITQSRIYQLYEKAKYKVYKQLEAV